MSGSAKTQNDARHVGAVFWRYGVAQADVDHLCETLEDSGFDVEFSDDGGYMEVYRDE